MATFFADLSAAVKDGVKEFSQTAIHEVTETVKEGTQTVVSAPQKIINTASTNDEEDLEEESTVQVEASHLAKDGDAKSLKRFRSPRRSANAKESVAGARSSPASTSRTETSLEELGTKVRALFVDEGQGASPDKVKLQGECESLLKVLRANARKKQSECASLQRKLAQLKKEKEALTQDSDALTLQVQDITASLEAKLSNLKKETRKAVAEKEAGEASLKEMKALMKQTSEERNQLAARVTELEQEAVETEAMSKASSAAQKEELHGRVIAAEQLASEVEKKWKEAEERATDAEREKEKANEACAKAEASALESAKRAEDSLAQLEIERGSREEAQGQQEQLHKDSERRKAAFQQALQAAVGGIERKLEAENEKLYHRLKEAEENLVASEESCADLKKLRLTAEQESEERGRVANAAELSKEAAEKAAAEAIQGKLDALQRAEDLESELEKAGSESQSHKTSVRKLEAKEKEMKGQLEDYEKELEACKKESTSLQDRVQSKISSLERDLERARKALQESRQSEQNALREIEVNQAKQSTAPSMNHHDSSERVKELERRLFEAEAKISEKNSASSTSKGSGPFNSLQSFSLEKIGLGKLGGSKEKSLPMPLTSRRPATKKGQISLRTWLLVIYLVVVHIAVMRTVTQEHELEIQCDSRSHIGQSLSAPS
ncbi:hypothetical protein HOP50_01g08630 [Chloropicon primus]|nr:hypothetical protein HOP50_01g08630 [Chloropicon primus]